MQQTIFGKSNKVYSFILLNCFINYVLQIKETEEVNTKAHIQNIFEFSRLCCCINILHKIFDEKFKCDKRFFTKDTFHDS